MNTKSILILLIILTFSSNIYGFNSDLYDIRKPIKKNIAVNLNKLENKEYLLNILEKLKKEISKNDKTKKIFSLRSMYGLLLWYTAENKEKESISKLNIKWAQEFLKYYPTNSFAMSMKSLFLGTYGLSQGVMNALYISNMGKKSLERAYELGNKWQKGFAAALLGRQYFKLPPYPISFGNLKSATKFAKISIKYQPNNAMFYEFLAEIYAYKGEVDKAIKILNKIKEIKPKCWYDIILKNRIINNYDIFLEILKSQLKGKYNKYKYDFFMDPRIK